MNQYSQIFFNRCFDKNKLKGLISWSLKNYGEGTTLELVEKLKDIGFSWATNAGISLSIDDLKIPKEKGALLFSAEQVSENAVQQFLSGNLTTVERLQQLIDAWHRTSELLKQEVVQNFRRTDPLNPVYMMAFSGARGNISQVRQLVGMRGLMADPQGRIIDFPIRSNFREGLTLTEYVISCYGARKGIVDTALRTATSGYLTRRLVDVAQHVVVSSYDCETKNGIFLTSLKQGSKAILPLSDRLIGRILGDDLPGIASKNESISPYIAGKIGQSYDRVFVRSPLTCEARTGVCQLCYGWSLAHGDLVSIGEAVGIIAAQSIGEPGTQLTMRTFHTGGVFSGEIIDQIEAPCSGIIEFLHQYRGTLVRTSYGKIGFLTRQAGYLLIKNNHTVTKVDFPSQTILFVRQGQQVEATQIVGEYASSATDQDQGIQSTHLVTSPQKGEIFFEDVIIINDDNQVENQAHQLGSFWILSSELEPNALKSLATFSFFPGDLISKNSPISTFTVVQPNNLNSTLVTGKKGLAEENKIVPYVNFNLLNFSKEQVIYSNGLHSVSLKNDYLNALSFKSGYFPIFKNVTQLIFSILQLNSKSQENLTVNKLDRALLVFSLTDKWFLASFNFSNKLRNGSKYKSRSLDFYSRKEFPTIHQRKDFPLNRKKLTAGTYIFKTTKVSKVLRSSFENTLGSFYTKNDLNRVVKFQKKTVNWVLKIHKTSIKDLKLLRKQNETQWLLPSFLFTTHLAFRLTNFKTCTGILEKVYTYKTSYVFKGNSLFSTLFKKYRNFESVWFKIAQIFQTKGSYPLNFVKKVNYFPIFANLFSIDPYLNSFKILNKQTVDKKLSEKQGINFSFEQNKVNNSFVGLISLNSENDLRWEFSSTEFFENLNLFETVRVLFPNFEERQTFDKLDWRTVNGQFFQNQYILGKIDKKLTKPMELLKVLKTKDTDQFLFLSKNDLFGIKVKTDTVNQNIFLGALVRPGDEIGRNFTISKSGQIFAIQKNKYIIRNAFPILFSEKANFHVFHGEFIEKGLPLITLSYKRLTTGDIVQGIPRIEQLFEARQTTTILHDQLHELFETYRTRMKLDQAARKSFQKIQRILIDSIQRVYQTQGVTISDKHLEIIIRQMTSTVRILDGGRTRLLRGELKPIDWIEKINMGIDIQKAEYEPILLGITKASLETESFISAASFQETTRTLSRAAIEGRTDYLRGLKENVILGHRVPAGTGAPLISYLTKFSTEPENITPVLTEF